MLSQTNAFETSGSQALGARTLSGTGAGALPVELLLQSTTVTSADFWFRPRRSRRRLSRSEQLVSPAYDFTKRSIDILGSLVLLVMLAPVMIGAAIAVKLTSRGPALYRQSRLTVGRRAFQMLKFRTMIDGAEKLSGPIWASENDPRITRVGKFLRSTRIDELPQLINVLRGEMSLIGPRPERPEIAAELTEQFPYFDQRHAVRGGITGLAQVQAGYADSLQSYRHKLAFDVIYIERRSLALDFIIALKTIRVVFTGRGAR